MEKEKLQEINDFLNQYALKYHKTFSYQNCAMIYDLSLEMLKKIQKTERKTPYSLEIELDLFSSIKIARDYLETLNCGYEETLDQYLMDGTISLRDIAEDEMEGTKNSRVYYYKTEKEKIFTDADLYYSSNYSDPGLIVHEFFHTQNFNFNGKIRNSRTELTEMISIYFENEVLDYMEEQGYNQQEIAKVRVQRTMSTTNSAQRILKFLPWINIFESLGDIKEDIYQQKEINPYQIIWSTEEDYQKDLEYLYSTITKNTIEIPSTWSHYVLGENIVNYVREQKRPGMTQTMLELNNLINHQPVLKSFEMLEIPLGPEANDYFTNATTKNLSKNIAIIEKEMIK